MEKDEQIIQELKRRAKEDVRFGSITIEFKIQDGKIVAGEKKGDVIKLG